MGVESLQEAGEERVRDWKNWKFFCNIVQYFAMGKAHIGRNYHGRGRESSRNLHGTGI